MNKLTVQAGGRLTGEVALPGDKSLSHRAVMLGALADGPCRVRSCLLGDDVRATVSALEAMGVEIEIGNDQILTVHGVGVDGLNAPRVALDLGNSGTSMRLLSGIVAGAGIAATLIGDASLSTRPMKRVADPLRRMGARIETSADGTPPLRIAAAGLLKGIDYAVPMASAQIKSAVLLAGLLASGTTRVSEPAPTRDHTERMLEAFGVKLSREGPWIGICGGQRLQAVDITIPADISSAAFFIVGAAIAEGSRLVLPGVGVNPTRTGVIDILREMGADIALDSRRSYGAEPVADISVTGSVLDGIRIPPESVSLAIDEFPAIFVAAACARGQTVLRGAEELRHKESDRIVIMAEGLRQLGVAVETFDDGIAIEGGELTGGEVDAHGDHRVAMAFAMAALRASGPISIRNAAAIATSFPAFAETARNAGLRAA
ncbi:MAG: 3-phosphoshikimate 1-carboxyvinyltransferase [Pseudomonadota bacterium]|nr:3-phosphoshikimate 1-carboxyvinyltransferase [Pseudomonadota bacterium]